VGANSIAEKSGKTPAHPLLRGYLEHLSNERRLSRHTVENYARDITALFGLAGNTPLKQLQVQNVRRFVAQLHARGLDGRSLGRMLSAWRGFFHYLARDHSYTQNPCLGIRPPKSAKRLPHALSPDEAGRLMEIAATDPLAVRDKAILELLYSSGLRLSELTGLAEDDVNLRDATVRVTGKGSKTRIVPVGSHALAALKVWLPARGKLARAGEGALRRPGRKRARSARGAVAVEAMGVEARARRQGAPACVAAFLCLAPAAVERGSARGAGIAGAREHFDDAGVHAPRFPAPRQGLRRGASAGEKKKLSAQAPAA